MKILFVVPKINSDNRVYYLYPIGIGYLSAYLKSKGYSVRIVDLNYYKDHYKALINCFKEESYQIVCTGGLSTYYLALKNLISLIRIVSPESVVVVGGGIVSTEPELSFQNLKPDYAVYGEGEATLYELIKCIENGIDVRGIKGVVFRNDDGNITITEKRPVLKDLDSLPFPDYDGLNITTFLERQHSDGFLYYMHDSPRVMYVMASRSCPMSCTFCYDPAGNIYRQRSIENFFSEIDLLIDKYNINGLVVFDELLAADKERLYQFCETIRAYKIPWLCRLRVDNVDEASLQLLKYSGCCYINYGIESAHDSILASMNKKTTINQIETALDLTRKAGIGFTGNFIFGDPEETEETANETLRWWRKYHYYNLNMGYILPYPGSQFYKTCVSRSLGFDKIRNLEKNCPVVNISKMSQDSFVGLEARMKSLIEEYRIYGKPTQFFQYHGYDDMREGHIYNFDVQCPHCDSINQYRRFYLPGDISRIICRWCNQRYDIYIPYMKYKSQFIEIADQIRQLGDNGIPISLTPWLNDNIVQKISEEMALEFTELNFRYVFDKKPDAEKMNGHWTVLKRDREMIRRHAEDHIFVVLPAISADDIETDLINHCGVSKNNIIRIPMPLTWDLGKSAPRIILQTNKEPGKDHLKSSIASNSYRTFS